MWVMAICSNRMRVLIISYVFIDDLLWCCWLKWSLLDLDSLAICITYIAVTCCSLKNTSRFFLLLRMPLFSANDWLCCSRLCFRAPNVLGRLFSINYSGICSCSSIYRWFSEFSTQLAVTHILVVSLFLAVFLCLFSGNRPFWVNDLVCLLVSRQDKILIQDLLFFLMFFFISI